MRKREPFPLTDEEVIRKALKTVTDYSNRNPGDTFNVNVCVERTLASVHRVWREARNYSPHQALKWEDQVEYKTFSVVVNRNGIIEIASKA
jgi:hypothetical protein